MNNQGPVSYTHLDVYKRQAYYSFKLQMRRYNLDPEMLRPYFEVKKRTLKEFANHHAVGSENQKNEWVERG